MMMCKVYLLPKGLDDLVLELFDLLQVLDGQLLLQGVGVGQILLHRHLLRLFILRAQDSLIHYTLSPPSKHFFGMAKYVL